MQALISRQQPNGVFTTIGNRAMSTATNTRDFQPYPNQKPIRGTMARIGMSTMAMSSPTTATFVLGLLGR